MCLFKINRDKKINIIKEVGLLKIWLIMSSLLTKSKFWVYFLLNKNKLVHSKLILTIN